MGISSLDGWNDEYHVSNNLSEPISIFQTIFPSSSVFICDQISEEHIFGLEEKSHTSIRNV